MSLRERKKERTRANLAEAAYDLAIEQGMPAVTAEAVAARAGVSRRTLFNYFPSVDAALTAAVEDFFTGVSEVIAAVPADVPIMDALTGLLDAPAAPELLQRVSRLASLGENSPHARAIILELSLRWHEWLEEHLAQRLPQAPEIYVTNLAQAIRGAAEAAIRVWGRRTGGALTPQSLALHQDLLAQSLGYLRTGFAEPPTDHTRPQPALTGPSARI